MALSEEDLQVVTDRINSTVNGVVATLKKQSEAQRQKDAEAQNANFAKLLDEKLAAFKPTVEDPDDKTGKGGKNGKVRVADDPEFAAMKRQVQEQADALRTANEREQRMRARSVDSSVREQVYAELGSIGLDAVRSKAAFAAFKIDNALETEVDEDGESVSVLFKTEDGTSLPLKDGIRGWAKSDAAKLYLPASGASGAGSRPAKGGSKDPPKRDVTFEDIGTWAAQTIATNGGMKLGE